MSIPTFQNKTNARLVPSIIHSARPTVLPIAITSLTWTWSTRIADSDLCFLTCCLSVHSSVPTFQNLAKTKQISSEMARLWVWQSGSLMTPVLFVLFCKILRCGDGRTYRQHVQKQSSLSGLLLSESQCYGTGKVDHWRLLSYSFSWQRKPQLFGAFLSWAISALLLTSCHVVKIMMIVEMLSVKMTKPALLISGK